jgi:hypothetical protein
MDAKGYVLPDPESLPEGEDPIIAWATLVKEKTEDGMFVVNPGQMGARVAVDLRTTTRGAFFNKQTKQYHMREIIFKIDGGGLIPTELLAIE